MSEQQRSAFIKAFNNHTTRRRLGDGSYSVRCRKGLWGVRAASEQEAMREAARYFALYHADGEYAEAEQ